MFDFKLDNWHAYYETVADIIETPEVQSMHRIGHHIDMTCYEHSVFVSYISFRTARRLGLDARAAARGGLLHDLYLYGQDTRDEIGLRHLLMHPKIALDNAAKLCVLSEKERNIIASHMWPLSAIMPKSREAFLVSSIDKYCATAEAMKIWHKMQVRKHLPITVMS